MSRHGPRSCPNLIAYLWSTNLSSSLRRRCALPAGLLTLLLIGTTIIAPTAVAGAPAAHSVRVAAASTVSIVSSGPVSIGTDVVVTVAAAGDTPTGTVSVSDNGVTAADKTLVDGLAAVDLGPLPLGHHLLVATYEGDANNDSATSDPVDVVVQKHIAQASIVAAPVTPWGSPLAVSGTVGADGQPAVGTVHLYRGDTLVGVDELDAAGAYLITVPATALQTVGSAALVLKFDGDNAMEATTATQTHIVAVRPSTTTVVLRPTGSSTYGQTVTVVARVNAAGPIPTGKVRLAGPVSSDAALVDGQAAFVLPAGITAGTHAITVSYLGTGNTATSAARSSLSVARLGTTVTGASTGATYGARAKVSFAVTAGTTGTLTATVDGHAVTAPVAARSLLLPALNAGAKIVALKYSGDANHSSASTSLRFSIKRATSTVSGYVSPVRYGSAARVVVKASGAGAVPTGRVLVRERGRTLATGALARGSVVIALSRAVKVGVHPLTVIYVGDANHLPRTGSLNLTVGRAAVVLKASAARSTYGTGQHVGVTVTGPQSAPTGTVTVSNGAAKVSAAVRGGHAALVLPKTWGPWSKILLVRYSGSGSHLPTSTKLRSVIIKAASRMAATASRVTSPHRALVSVAVTGAGSRPTGTVTITRSGVGSWRVALHSGRAALLLPKLPGGTYRYAVGYNGDPRHNRSSTTVTVRVGAAPRPVAPKPIVTPAPVPVPTYANCTDVWNRLGRSIYPSDPGFQSKFDRDGDGVGCEVDPR